MSNGSPIERPLADPIPIPSMMDGPPLPITRMPSSSFLCSATGLLSHGGKTNSNGPLLPLTTSPKRGACGIDDLTVIAQAPTDSTRTAEASPTT
eukprot:CAMPEP_0115547100 /NCGR_PEP_ID=MMETSP0271-20121206/93470_1 /TAXON_ID=71861 /ORGANISM="Scrippsiella trochoidea, Strain CCMP3099" /LENGTH=93 /DNA_ID=CAMNT_0002980517 /DNA_START=212 /DNA_END=490 /DNA_ORIENTATION=-